MLGIEEEDENVVALAFGDFRCKALHLYIFFQFIISTTPEKSIYGLSTIPTTPARGRTVLDFVRPLQGVELY